MSCPPSFLIHIPFLWNQAYAATIRENNSKSAEMPTLMSKKISYITKFNKRPISYWLKFKRLFRQLEIKKRQMIDMRERRFD